MGLHLRPLQDGKEERRQGLIRKWKSRKQLSIRLCNAIHLFLFILKLNGTLEIA